MRSLTHIEPPRADTRRVDAATRAYELAALIRQRDAVPIITRHRGRLGQGERSMTRAPRLSNGRANDVTVKLADFTRTGRIKDCIEIETVPARRFAV